MTPVSGTCALKRALKPSHALTPEIHTMLSKYWASISTAGTTLSAQGRFKLKGSMQEPVNSCFCETEKNAFKVFNLKMSAKH